MARRIVVGKADPVSAKDIPDKDGPADQGLGKAAGIGVQKVFQLRLDFIVSHGNKYDGESHEEVMAKFRAFVKENWPDAHFTPTGGYYLIDDADGRREVCRPQDFDCATMARKPGTHPPSWSLTAEQQTALERQMRVTRELAQPALTRNPTTLYTAKELDRMAELDREVKRGKAKALGQIAEEHPEMVRSTKPKAVKVFRAPAPAEPARKPQRSKVLIRKRPS